jgi:hypothetical protein
MLNELLIVERGARQAGIEMPLRHPDIKDAARKPTLLVFLDSHGHVARIELIASSRLKERPLWKLVDGQKNSFPFVQTKPFWDNKAIQDWKRRLSKKPSDLEKRQLFTELASASNVRSVDLGEWASAGMLEALRKRRKTLILLEKSDIAVLPITIDRFLVACDKTSGGDPSKLILEIAHRLVEELQVSASADLLEAAIALCVETGNKSGALYFAAEGNSQFDLTDDRLLEQLCQHLRKIDLDHAQRRGFCSITGKENVVLVSDHFSQPNLPVIQQSFLFARNEAIPSASRYGKKSSDSISVEYMTDIRLRAAIEALCSASRRGITWRAIPGEAPKQSDLLLAFVDEALDAPAIDILSGNAKEDDFSEEIPNSVADSASSVAAFEKRTERLIEVVQAKVKADLRSTPVRLMVIRKVDPANRKVVYASAPTVADLYNAAITWVGGERNVPPWLTLPILQKGEQKPRPMGPPHVAPLELIAFSKKVYIRGGTESQEVVGWTAAETLRCFLDPSGKGDLSARHRVKRFLWLVLRRRATFVTGTAHALRRGFDFAKNYDRHETLRTITILGVLLHKLDRNKEVYMNETAFKLGQLLAAADVVHAGYCADVRGGAVPPSLLGNQFFAMAQTAPIKALAMFCRRWKPYDGWAKKASRDPNRAEALIASKQKSDQQRGWDIKKALRHTREMGPLATELAPALEGCCLNDTFLAELLLGYIAGLPKAQREDGYVQDPNQNEKQED